MVEGNSSEKRPMAHHKGYSATFRSPELGVDGKLKNPKNKTSRIKNYDDDDVTIGDLVRDPKKEVWTLVGAHDSGPHGDMMIVKLKRKNPLSGADEMQKLSLWMK